MKTMPRFPKKIDANTFYEWSRELAKRDMTYHIDDNPADIVCVGSGKRLFTDRQAKLIGNFLDHVADALGVNLMWETYAQALKDEGVWGVSDWADEE